MYWKELIVGLSFIGITVGSSEEPVEKLAGTQVTPVQSREGGKKEAPAMEMDVDTLSAQFERMMSGEEFFRTAKQTAQETNLEIKGSSKEVEEMKLGQVKYAAAELKDQAEEEEEAPPAKRGPRSND